MLSVRTGFVFLILSLCASQVFAQPSGQRFEARVVYVNDGDTCRVQDRNGHLYKIRLFGIDAPESDQPAGQTARQVLESFIGNREFVVRLTGAETYGRHVARLFVGDVYVNEELVRDGWAWHYDRYTEGDERDWFTRAEEAAQEERIGLWASDNPIRPECWRRGDRDGDCQPDFGFERDTGRGFADRARPRVAEDAPARESDLAESRLDTTRFLTPAEKLRRFLQRPSRQEFSEDTRLPRTTSSAHTIFGRPVESDDRYRFVPEGHTEEVRGITELERIAFTVGHYDRYRLPAWVAMQWTADDYEQGIGVSLGRPSARVDTELPNYAQGGTSFQYNLTGLQRGHMAPDDLMESWGEDAVEEAVRMSNMVPQLQGRNHAVWTLLEGEIKEIVANEEDEFEIAAVWTIAGPVFDESQEVQLVGQPGTGVPAATYKIVGWFTGNDEFTARAYIIDQFADDTDLWTYLVSIDQVELVTGINFFHELPDSQEQQLEADIPENMWE